MAETYIINATSNNALSIFSGTKIGQPYRCQPELRIVVSFQEYVKFIKSMVKVKVSFMSFDLKFYNNVIDKDNEALWISAYYYDMSKAVNAEFKIALAWREDSTVITHGFDDIESTGTLYLEDIGDKLSELDANTVSSAEEDIRKELPDEFNERDLSPHMMKVYKYIIWLRAQSYSGDAEKFNFKIR